MKLLLMDIWVCTRYAWAESLIQTKRNLSMMFYAVPYVMALFVYLFIAPMMTFLAGIVLQLIVAAFLADYMDYIHQITLLRMSDKKEHKRNFRTYFRTAFVLIMLLYFINYAFSLLIVPLFAVVMPFMLAFPFSLVLYGALFMTPYLESLYIGNEDIGSAFSEVLSFMKRNAWVWIINALVLLLTIWVINTGFSKLIALIPLPAASQPFVSLLILGAVYQFLLGFAMLYRANLYEVMSKGSRQARIMRLLNKKNA